MTDTVPLLMERDGLCQALCYLRSTLIEKRALPGGKYVLGADEFGRDILSRVIHGSRVALLVGVLSTAIAVIFGLLLGTVAGFAGVGSMR